MDDDGKHGRDQPTSGEKTWAVIRFVLGLAQMMGAVIAAYLLIQTGVNTLSLGAVALTCMFTTISVMLFGGRRRDSR